MDYHWFPGHMAKTIRQIKEDIKLIDLVIEVLDSRIPRSSMNPILNEIAKNKPRLIIMNKSDMSEKLYNEKWEKYFISKGYHVVLTDAKNKKGIKNIYDKAIEACSDIIERNIRRGLKNKTIKAMVFGIPNTGKSTIINAISGKNVTKTGNTPGVTRGKQWIRLGKNIELLDTPGVLWHKFEDMEVGKKIAFIGSIKNEVVIIEELAYDLLTWLSQNKQDYLVDKYDIIINDPLEALEKIAQKRGCLLKGAKLDLTRASNLFLEEFRNAKLGRITLDREICDE